MIEGIRFILPLLGGLGLFLYGMTIMSSGLEKSAGDRLERIIEKLSGKVYKGVIVGTIVTILVQSSSATTVMVVGFVNAGIMSLKQAIGIIMGANVGTTVTGQLVSINLTMLAPLAIALGVGMVIFGVRTKFKVLGEIVLGFGMLFLGMEMMKDALSPVREMTWFSNLIYQIGGGSIWGTLEGFLIGLFMTAIVQSSSATTGIMVALAGTGALPIEAAFPMLMGTNVGTCVTALLSSITANKTAKRAAVMHLLFNILGTILFLTLFSHMTLWIVAEIGGSAARQLANAHTLFNVLNTALLLPFAGLIVKSAEIIVPISEDEMDSLKTGAKYLDDRILNTPQIAVGQVVKEVMHMAKVTKESLGSSFQAITLNHSQFVRRTFELEKKINLLERQISDYLIKLSNTNLDNSDRIRIDGLFNTINDLERVGDHADNIAELADYKIQNGVRFSDKAMKELKEMIDVVSDCFEMALQALDESDREKATKAISYEGVIDQMEKELRKKHIARLNDGRCETSSGIVFLDMLSNLERVSDHAANIASAVLDVIGE